MTARERTEIMRKQRRVQMLKSMEFICRNLNDEDHLEIWLNDGIADGDIEYGNFDCDVQSLEDLDYYLDDKHFADVMDTFIFVMKQVDRDGGLYCDNVLSKAM